MRALAAGILFLFSLSSAAERWADSVPESHYDFGGKPVSDRVSTRPQLIPFKDTEIEKCKPYAGRPLPPNSQRRLYRHIFLSKLHQNAQSILENVHGDNMGYQDCMAGGTARPGSILGNCSIKKKAAEDSLELYKRWRGSMYIAGLQFTRPEMQGANDGIWGGEKTTGIPKSPLKFGSDQTLPESDEMKEIRQRIDQGKKKIATILLAETQFVGGKCYQLEGVDLVRTDSYYQNSACYLRDAGVREKAQRLFMAEAKRQMAEDSAQIVAHAPWVAYMNGDPKTVSVKDSFDKLNSELERGRDQIKLLKPADLQADQRMSLAASKHLLNSTVANALDSPAENDIPNGVSPELHRQYLCSAAQEIVDDLKTAKKQDAAALFVIGASGGVACIASGLIPCIVAGSATALTADAIKLKSLYADQTANSRAFLSGHRGADEFKEIAAEIESEVYNTYALMPANFVVPVALHGAFRLIPVVKAGAH